MKATLIRCFLRFSLRASYGSRTEFALSLALAVHAQLAVQKKRHNPLRVMAFQSAPTWNRTKNLLIKSLRECGGIPGESGDSEAGAAPGAAVGMALGQRLADLLDAWERLDDERRRGVLAMLDGVVAMIDGVVAMIDAGNEAG
ncbi:MAG: hypothetical protein O3C40_29655 [Planctomycetota bacterium]|nr:hypothetical protein [Planctomycetota bacterium]